MHGENLNSAPQNSAQVKYSDDKSRRYSIYCGHYLKAFNNDQELAFAKFSHRLIKFNKRLRMSHEHHPSG